jgi:hypothetical protein
MLHTTAMALGDQATQSFAEQGLRTYAAMVQELNHLIPEAVVEDLRTNEDVPAVDTSVAGACRQIVDGIWKDTAHAL